MKKTDIAMIVLIAAIGIVLAYFVASNLSFLKLPAKGIEVQTIRKIALEVAQPDEKIFNKDAINPTVEAIVGNSSGN